MYLSLPIFESLQHGDNVSFMHMEPHSPSLILLLPHKSSLSSSRIISSLLLLRLCTCCRHHLEWCFPDAFLLGLSLMGTPHRDLPWPHPLHPSPSPPMLLHSLTYSTYPFSRIVLSNDFFYLLIILCIYLFLLCLFILAAQAFSNCSEQGLLFVVAHGLLIAVASLLVEHRL